MVLDLYFHASIFLLHSALLLDSFFPLSFLSDFESVLDLQKATHHILFLIWPHIIFVFPLFLSPLLSIFFLLLQTLKHLGFP